MNIEELEQTYQEFLAKSLKGEIDEQEFKASVERLRFEDEQGQQWKLGWYTGKWYRYEQGRWIHGEPTPSPAITASLHIADSSPGAAERSERRSRAPWLAILLILVLLLAAAALVAGWVRGWWGGSVAAPTVAAVVTGDTPPTSAATATRPLPTSTPEARSTPVHTRQAANTPEITPSPPASPERTEPPPPASATPSATTRSAQPSLSGQIFFPVYDPEQKTFNIHTITLGSAERRMIVSQASQPAISPNGKRLAYRSWDRAHRSIQVRELIDGHTWTWINFAEAARPSWSPDSENIVFPSQQESDRRWRVYRSLGLEYELVRRHGGDIFGRVPVYLADGRIAYWECPLDDCGLYVMQGDGSSPVRLTVNEHDTAPAGSPDGNRLAFMSNADGNWEIYVVDTETRGGQGGQGLRRLTENPARDGLPTWSPDGNWLAFVTDREGEWAVWAMRADGSGQHRLFDLDGPLEGEIAFVSAEDQHGWTWETIAWGP